MINKIIKNWEDNKHLIREELKKSHPHDYLSLVKLVVSHVGEEIDDQYHSLDPNRIHCIDDGEYKGAILFIIGADYYQPHDYWYVMINYGSCSGCDTFEFIKSGDYGDYGDNPPSDQQIDDYMTLALHIVQGIKKLGE